MGRPRKLLQNQKGNLTKVTQIAKEAEESALSQYGREDLLTTPEELQSDYAVKTWNRIVPLLMQSPVTCDIDRDNIICYCNAWDDYVSVTERLKYADEPVLIRALHEVQKEAMDAQRKYGALIGMSIDSRLKMASAHLKKEAEQVDQTFGVI